MNIAQIENNISNLINNFSNENFIYDFLLAYGAPKNTITLLKKGKRNLSKKNDQLILKKKVFFQAIIKEDLHASIDILSNESETYRHEPRFIIVTNYKELLAIDTKTKDTLDTKIPDLNKSFVFFLPLAGMEKANHKNENLADVKAAERMAKIYDEILKDNKFETKEDLHSLNIFLSRLLFCFFAEDTGIFSKGIFTNSISSFTQVDGSDLDVFFNTLFEVLNLLDRDPQIYPPYLNIFPYVNGGLFAKKHSSLKFSLKSRKMMLESGALDWSKINPDIFGSMIQAVVHPEQRGGLGMHYTSVPNIMKVIEPLFLNEIRDEFKINFNNAAKLEKLLIRLANFRIFDPACGSGNFLIIAYKEIRTIEIEIFKRLQEISPQMSIPFSWISLSQFFGIELDDFACEIAILSLWLAEHQMNLLFKDTFGQEKPFLPLKDGGNIVCENALKIEWDSVCPKNDKKEVFILGNPPYLGSSLQDKVHKKDMDCVFQEIKGYKNLDYIACWFFKGAKYIHDSTAKLAFVSTNSICQGEQVALLWPHIFKLNLEINFAHISFKWSNNAKANAGVTCCVIGLRKIQKSKPKYLYDKSTVFLAENISPYLTKNRNIFIIKRSKPLSNFPLMTYGNKPVDGGNLILSEEEKNFLLNNYPSIKKFIRPFVGSLEFINGFTRYCIWIKDTDLDEALKIPPILERIKKVKEMRLKSTDTGANKLALRSHQFRDMTEAKQIQIIIPCVTSERREYIPFGFLDSAKIISNSGQVIYDPPTHIFAIIFSRMHMIWVRAVAGRLETRIRYSSVLCYNTFPFPYISESQETALRNQALRIIDIRENFSEKTMADLYDPDTMPQELQEAHSNLDKIVELCYRSKPFSNDEERLEYLFDLYEKMILDEEK